MSLSLLSTLMGMFLSTRRVVLDNTLRRDRLLMSSLVTKSLVSVFVSFDSTFPIWILECSFPCSLPRS